jgi:multiple sugar transport system ATP-binding protein
MANLILDHITKKFGETVAVDDFSLHVNDGEFMVLLGPSGAGKTTTLKLIAGVEQVNGGLIYIGDRLMNPLEPQRRNVAMAFETYALYPHMKVYENLAFPLRAPGRNMTAQQIDSRVREIAELLGITQFLDRAPAHLSGGQRQRVSLGRAMVREPDILLLDEPISHLDAKLRHRMRAEFKAISASINTTILYVTHDYLEALSLSDRVAVMDQGKLLQVGTPDDVFVRPKNTFVAALLGQPKINLIRCSITTHSGQMRLCSKDGTINLLVNAQIQSILNQLNLNEVVIGIRPFHMAVANGQDKNQFTEAIQGNVYVYERLGTRGILTMSVGEMHMDVITPISMDFDIDRPVTVAVDMDQALLFHPETEENILLTE